MRAPLDLVNSCPEIVKPQAKRLLEQASGWGGEGVKNNIGRRLGYAVGGVPALWDVLGEWGRQGALATASWHCTCMVQQR